jgi:hypothetical protein
VRVIRLRTMLAHTGLASRIKKLPSERYLNMKMANGPSPILSEWLYFTGRLISGSVKLKSCQHLNNARMEIERSVRGLVGLYISLHSFLRHSA